MRIAFYAPLKAPGHPVPSGDRLMARLLIAALERAGHHVEIASELRARLPRPDDQAALAGLQAAASAERARIAGQWQAHGAPDLWFCYHPYYKSPDLIGPELARRFGLPWVSAEASLSRRRTDGIWTETQSLVAGAVTMAGMNFGLTARDRAGLADLAPGARIMALAPFLDLETLPPAATLTGKRLITVAMMREGDKLASYQALALALAQLPPHSWELAVAGDGPAASGVHQLFAPGQVDWRGALAPEGVAALLASGALYVWPGRGEAYGLAYLEAQAAGLPVVAYATAGVPEVVEDGETGILVADGDTPALAEAVARLLDDPALRARMGAAARARVLARHGIDRAAQVLDAGLRAARERAI